jgi:hypothetical protein
VTFNAPPIRIAEGHRRCCRLGRGIRSAPCRD